jgi:hypothetical protein
MPTPAHLRVTALGRLASSGERFSYGLNIANLTGSFQNFVQNDEPMKALMDDIAADIVAFHGDPLMTISPRAVLEEVKFANIGADGKYTTDPYIKNVPDTPGGYPVQSEISFMYPQNCLAISLSTDRRGPTGKGRFFVPMVMAGTDTDCRITQTLTTQYATRAQAFLNAVNNLPGLDTRDYAVVVASTKGYVSRVTGVRVGRVVDTMRSRRTSIPEDYSAIRPVS